MLRNISVAVTIGMGVLLSGVSSAHVVPAPISTEADRIQIAILLDTSNSMDGLIDQAKSQLWMLVNELGDKEKNGIKPDIELSLYQYGNSNLPMTEGYIQQIMPFSRDLDAVSEKLFALTTKGGQEFAGQVIDTSLQELSWSDDKDDMKLIVIAGNEPFTQGPVKWQTACERAKDMGVVIDTVHCGNAQRGIDTDWKAGAECSGGVYLTIDQDEKYVQIVSPYDEDIKRLNKALNDTYIGYGKSGAQFKERQIQQDQNALKMGISSALSRAKSKASKQYSNEVWDVVDAYKKSPELILNQSEDDLPEQLKGKSESEKKAYIESLSSERAAIQSQINDLQTKRNAYVATEKQKMAKTNTLDEIVVTAISEQAESQGFK